MDLKTIFAKIFAAILGIEIVGFLFTSIYINFIVVLYMIIFKPDSITFFISRFFMIPVLLSLGAGVYLGLRSYKNKDLFYNIFRPNISKVIISLILSFIMNIYIGLIYPILDYILMIVFYIILFYPFSALCYFIYKYRNNKLFRDSKFVVILLLVLLSPFFLIFGQIGAITYASSLIHEPCGVKITDYTEISAAKEYGVPLGEIITKIDETKITSIIDFSEFINRINSSNELNITTKNNSYKIKPFFDENKNMYTFGVYASQQLCSKKNKK